MADAGALFALAWRVVPRLPAGLTRRAFELGGVLAHAARIAGVRRLEANLARVADVPDAAALRRLSRRAMRSYMRYYSELFQLRTVTRDQLRARVRTIGLRDYREQVTEHMVIGALPHMGNWDLAGAWSGQHFAHVTTVAETLEPESLFREFLDLREGLGMTIFPYRKGTGVFRQLLGEARTRPGFMPMLADRDLGRDGVVVRVNGHPMRVAPGAAAVALATKQPFIGVFIHYERLRGSRRRAAGSPWGIAIEFTAPIEPPAGAGSREAVAAMMQTWADHLTRALADHPQDWHMLQKCFLADLDLDRLQGAGGRATPDGTIAGGAD
ncbi:phosphatidylinositol mannoside acyltransferase [Pseudactinotalea sp. HY160]|uniref:phosphatidylinositol mannoside acyltransferase n=1 Tax=Pseudactinotalea sp. HY160 TaxID=2654490 RepID=UPI00128E7077|nr:phosphatidylinositol mannoside acyltransferase [Pseudactinotalea sp. HY160]MPV49377.1 phosphatidylinositol mannoside acyltransferase [Pseudactinotalea sp. HY160]